MPSVKFIKKIPKSTSYNFKYICDRYDLDVDNFQKEWDFSFDFPKSWKIGLIVGNSGSGKSLVSKEIFGKVYDGNIIKNKNLALIECFEDCKIDDIIKSLCDVGMGSVPEWLTPYEFLSTGQKMRADIAACILNDEKLIVYDEFTSVVDRSVAKVISHSISKSFRNTEKQFVAVTCHHDVEDWLEPDWVLDMDTKEFRTLKKKDLKFPYQFTHARDKLGNFSKTFTI